ncbi:hypothetical protein E2C01_000774 [Portunus trituberculatus]|uniref:Secreted protein n=1 Tax=Portunus trituberculatus TaxID=210409 RepID=A0A5B7CFJ2_PORTR|nr:hypothetical protein [Portunus trituberculatus]
MSVSVVVVVVVRVCFVPGVGGGTIIEAHDEFQSSHQGTQALYPSAVSSGAAVSVLSAATWPSSSLGSWSLKSNGPEGKSDGGGPDSLLTRDFLLRGGCGVEATALGSERDASSSYTSLLSNTPKAERRLVGVLVRDARWSLASPGSRWSALPLVCRRERDRIICRDEGLLRVPSLRELERSLVPLPRLDSTMSLCHSSSPLNDSITESLASSTTRAWPYPRGPLCEDMTGNICSSSTKSASPATVRCRSSTSSTARTSCSTTCSSASWDFCNASPRFT